MNSKTKLVTGGSVVAVIWAMIQIAISINTLSHSDKNKKPVEFKNLPSTVIVTDSLGRKDTIVMEEYLRGVGK
jgi:hypothetical protein